MSKFNITSATLEQLTAFLTQLEYHIESTGVDNEDTKKAFSILSDFKSDVASHARELNSA